MIGVVIFMGVAGLLIARLEGSFRGAAGALSTIPVVIGYAIATGYATILLRGALNAVAPMILTAFVLAGVVHAVFRRAARRAVDPGSSKLVDRQGTARRAGRGAQA
jgi:hypothetical protein